ncbi:TetR family transcriptional regulator [Sphaerisporangium melleum]|uniref:TetR family transcriptional regulator n=1 Tax=Sphaerisporangium melleum TaxID=321316 RepID=A0A917RD03_9ACTN|nr:TetR family transcriptional regulator [Sphaerisporangium melleum]GGL02362.1 TetR family transcriptional regulator [Sphaerisporangium melleum]GII72237.1 TetR family transcriptional regulator [Sphaerisporangium melleum]
MKERARSAQDKEQRSQDLLTAAQALATELGGVRFITVQAVTERAGLHRTGVRRYYSSREELLLELAEQGWAQWRAAIAAQTAERTGLGPEDVAGIVTDTIIALPVFCDLLTHVALSLEGDVAMERARQYKTHSFAAYDAIVEDLNRAGSMTPDQLRGLIAATLALAANGWQVSHPTPTLAALYQQVPEWGHAAFAFAPRLKLLLTALAVGLHTVIPAPDPASAPD